MSSLDLGKWFWTLGNVGRWSGRFSVEGFSGKKLLDQRAVQVTGYIGVLGSEGLWRLPARWYVKDQERLIAAGLEP